MRGTPPLFFGFGGLVGIFLGCEEVRVRFEISDLRAETGEEMGGCDWCGVFADVGAAVAMDGPTATLCQAGAGCGGTRIVGDLAA